MSRRTTKQTRWPARPAKTRIRLGIRPVWSQSSISAWRNLGFFATHWAHSEDSDRIERMYRLIWVFAECTWHLFLSCGGSRCTTTTTTTTFATHWAHSEDSGQTWWMHRLISVLAERKCRFVGFLVQRLRMHYYFHYYYYTTEQCLYKLYTFSMIENLYTTLFSDVLFVVAKYETEKIIFVHSLHV